MLVELIDRLDESVGAGANTATIRAQLSTIREQAEALEARLKILEAQIKEYETKAQTQEYAPKRGELEEEAVGFLELLAQHRRLSIHDIASLLKISMVKAEYHRDVLLETDMISYGRRVASGEAEPSYVLLPKGRAYVVKNKLT